MATSFLYHVQRETPAGTIFFFFFKRMSKPTQRNCMGREIAMTLTGFKIKFLNAFYSKK